MAIEKKDIDEVAEELKGVFEEFKRPMIKSLTELKPKKQKLDEKVDELNQKLGQLDELKSELQKELKGHKRPDLPNSKRYGRT